MRRKSALGGRRILFTIALLAVLFLLSLRAVHPPPPKPSSAPPAEFSAGRAQEVLKLLVGSGIPHPVGSPADDAVRARILAQLTQFGYQPQIQTAFACDEYGTCATVKNVLARRDGKEPGASVLLASHYDSVPAGPGASDDGAGTAAVLEVARALKFLPQPRQSIIILIDEGEEAGLLGARAFVDQHPWAREVHAVVNIDARGTSGPSLMFETGSANLWAVGLYAHHASHPATSSIFYTAYKQVPNDTDFTIFRAAGYQGLNFANIGDVAQYHTPLDNFQNADPATLQHHGENALPALLALANADLSKVSPGEAVFFDLFERWTILWSASWTPTISLLVTAVLLLEIGWLIQKKRLTPAAFLWGLLSWLAMILVTVPAALLLQWLLRLAGALPVNWIAHPLPLEIAFWSLAITVVTSLALMFAPRAGFWGLWAGVWTWWGLLAIVLGWQSPGISYVLIVPAGTAALAVLPSALLRKKWGVSDGLAAILPLAAAAIVGFGPLLLLYDGLGNGLMPVICLVVVLLLSPLAPLAADLKGAPGLLRLAWTTIPILATILAAFATFVAPAYSAKSPEHVNLKYWQDGDSGKSQWIVSPDSGRLPEPIALASKFHRVEKGPFPWGHAPAFLADAPHLDIPAPTFTILESSLAGRNRNYRMLLRSERGAPEAMVFFPPNASIESVRVQGLPLEPETDQVRQFFNGWFVYGCMTMPEKGVEITFTLPTGKPTEVYVADETYGPDGLPIVGLFLLKARPLAATSSQDGDTTVVSRRVQLFP